MSNSFAIYQLPEQWRENARRWRTTEESIDIVCADIAEECMRDLRDALPAVRALEQERDELRILLLNSQTMEQQAKRYHESVYAVFERYCAHEIRTLVILSGQTLGEVLTRHLGERAEAAEAQVRALEAERDTLSIQLSEQARFWPGLVARLQIRIAEREAEIRRLQALQEDK